jgi:hypothetical protein
MNSHFRPSRVQTMTRPLTLLGVLILLVTTPGRLAAQGATGHQLTFQAYQQSMNTLKAALQQSNRTATKNALIPVMAINRALTSTLTRERARLTAASRIMALGDGTIAVQLADAANERMMQAFSATSWVATGDDEHRVLALVGHQTSLDKTQTALAALTGLSSQVQGMTLPPALAVEVTTSRGGGTLLFLVKVSNFGDTAAPTLTLKLTKGESIGGGAQEVTLGALPAGGTLQHVFGLALPPLTFDATAVVEASAPNAASDVYSVDIPQGT